MNFLTAPHIWWECELEVPNLTKYQIDCRTPWVDCCPQELVGHSMFELCSLNLLICREVLGRPGKARQGLQEMHVDPGLIAAHGKSAVVGWYQHIAKGSESLSEDSLPSFTLKPLQLHMAYMVNVLVASLWLSFMCPKKDASSLQAFSIFHAAVCRHLLDFFLYLEVGRVNADGVSWHRDEGIRNHHRNPSFNHHHRVWIPAAQRRSLHQCLDPPKWQQFHLFSLLQRTHRFHKPIQPGSGHVWSNGTRGDESLRKGIQRHLQLRRSFSECEVNVRRVATTSRITPGYYSTTLLQRAVTKRYKKHLLLQASSLSSA